MVYKLPCYIKHQSIKNNYSYSEDSNFQWDWMCCCTEAEWQMYFVVFRNFCDACRLRYLMVRYIANSLGCLTATTDQGPCLVWLLRVLRVRRGHFVALHPKRTTNKTSVTHRYVRHVFSLIKRQRHQPTGELRFSPSALRWNMRKVESGVKWGQPRSACTASERQR